MKKRADGRYRKVVDGKTFYGETEREVYKKILEYTEKKEKGLLFSEVADEWWSDSYDGFAAQTLKVYKPAYAEILDTFGVDRITEITPRQITAYYKSLAQRKLAYKTVANRRTVLNQICDHAVAEGYILYNPCASAQMPRNLGKIERLPATESEESKVINTRHAWLFPKIALLTGLRKGEILALQWKDINFTEKVISVTKSVEYLGNVPHIKAPKTAAGVRYVPLLDKLAKEFETVRGEDSHYIISEDGGRTPITNKRYHTLYTNYQKEVGITATAHQLRHSFATVAVEAGVEPKALQSVLGHTTIAMTMDIYAKARKKALNDTAKIMNSFIDI